MTLRFRSLLLGSHSLFSLPLAAQEASADAAASIVANTAEPEAEEAEEGIVVEGTRVRRRLRDEPIRVEVLAGEEIEEKAIMRPGNIAMLLAETGGLRVQTTSPALGAANIRVQGLDGRYTQLLADGLPLYGGQAASLGLLQIPPTDLGQVEVIKGAASALYGASALGGVINLISKRPGAAFEVDILTNATTRNGQDLTAHVVGPVSADAGLSLTGGFHRQTGQDLDRDGWFDMPAFWRATLRPRLQWNGGEGEKVYLTLGAMTEERTGGTLPGRTVPDGTPFSQTQDTDRFDAGLVAEMPVEGFGSLHLRGAAMRHDHLHRFGAVTEDDTHSGLFAEAATSGRSGGTSWVAGAAFQADRFRSETFPVFDYTYKAPGLFTQIEQEVESDLTLAASARLDFHSEFGTQFSPRLSTLYRPGNWTIRGSLGRGFFAPTPFVDEIEAAGLARLEPLAGLAAETATTASLDIGFARGPWEAYVTLFGSNIDNAVQLADVAADRVRLVNVTGQTRVRGSELLLRVKQEPFTVTANYVFVNADEPDPDTGARREKPLTPRHSAGLVGMWEVHGKGRIGVEAYYTGVQRLVGNPYRDRSRRYVHLGELGEIAIGNVSLFANAENLLDVRQSKYGPLLRSNRAASGEWTVDGWAPLEGRIFNAGIRLRFGGWEQH